MVTPRLCFARQTKAAQHHPGQADAELLERLAARNRLSQSLGQLVEFVVHNSRLALLIISS
jgi:hypothetical protein